MEDLNQTHIEKRRTNILDSYFETLKAIEQMVNSYFKTDKQGKKFSDTELSSIKKDVDLINQYIEYLRAREYLKEYSSIVGKQPNNINNDLYEIQKKIYNELPKLIEKIDKRMQKTKIVTPYFLQTEIKKDLEQTQQINLYKDKRCDKLEYNINTKTNQRKHSGYSIKSIFKGSTYGMYPIITNIDISKQLEKGKEFFPKENKELEKKYEKEEQIALPDEVEVEKTNYQKLIQDMEKIKKLTSVENKYVSDIKTIKIIIKDYEKVTEVYNQYVTLAENIARLEKGLKYLNTKNDIGKTLEINKLINNATNNLENMKKEYENIKEEYKKISKPFLKEISELKSIQRNRERLDMLTKAMKNADSQERDRLQTEIDKIYEENPRLLKQDVNEIKKTNKMKEFLKAKMFKKTKKSYSKFIQEKEKEEIRTNEKIDPEVKIEDNKQADELQEMLEKEKIDSQIKTSLLNAYMKEKVMQTDLGKKKFSEYIESVRPDLKELIEITKEEEKLEETGKRR